MSIVKEFITDEEARKLYLEDNVFINSDSRVTGSFEEVEVMFDGSCGPCNPNGNLGIGFMIKGDGLIIATGWGYSLYRGNPTSNNEAEWRALYEALSFLTEAGTQYDKLSIKGDSMLVINQLRKRWGISESKIYSHVALKTMSEFKSIIKKASVSHVGRDFNEECDHLSNKYIDYLMEDFGLDTGGPFVPQTNKKKKKY